MDKFNSFRKEIQDILVNSPVDFELKHSELVLKWVLELKPDADESLKIAAISHDLERAITKITEKDLKDYSKIDEFKKEHSIRSAQFASEILKKHNYPDDVILKVKNLIEKHEFGGDEESDILMNADSLAYFDYNIPSGLKRNGRERTKEKIKFMYKRLADKVKKLVQKIKYQDEDINKLIEESIAEL